MDANQVQRIQEIQTQPSIATHDDKMEEFQHEFTTGDTFMHSICTETYVQKLNRIVSHKSTYVLLLCMMLSIIVSISLNQHSLFDVLSIVFISTAIAWLILKHLLYNQEAFVLCIQTFDYWIKVGSTVTWSASHLLNDRYPNGYGLFVCSVLFASFVSSLDATPCSYTTKWAIPALMPVAVIFSYFSMFVLWDEPDTEYGQFQLENDPTSSLSSSYYILCIFYWRQAYQSWRHKGRECVVSEAPEIVCIDTTKKDGDHDSHVNVKQ
eukprot:22043_1